MGDLQKIQGHCCTGFPNSPLIPKTWQAGSVCGTYRLSHSYNWMEGMGGYSEGATIWK